MHAIELMEGLTSTVSEAGPGRWNVELETRNLLADVKALRDAHWGYLSAITGLDRGPDAGELEILYHFCEANQILTLRLTVSRDEAVVPSLTALIPSARLYEMELREMLGVTIQGLQAPSHLFLPDDWEEGTYPLRKDFALS